MSHATAQAASRQTLYRLALAVIAGVTAVSVAGAAEPPTLDEIKAQLKKQREKIESLYIEVKREEKPCVDVDVLLTLPDFANKILLTSDEVRFAFKGDKRYCRTIHPPDAKWLRPVGEPPKLRPNASRLERESHKRRLESYERMKQERARAERMGSKIGVAEGPTPDEIKAYNGRTQWRKEVRRNGDVYFHVDHPRDSMHWFQAPLYLAVVGLAIPDPLEKDKMALEGQRMGRLPDLLQRWPHTVSSEIEEIDGTPCVVLSGNIQFTVTVGEVSQTFEIPDKLWLDLEHGLAIRQAERRSPMGSLVRMVNSDFQEVLPGLWLPRKSEIHSFAPPGAPKELEGRPVMIGTLTLKKCVVNEVPDDLFNMVTKPGDLVIDSRDPKWHRP